MYHIKLARQAKKELRTLKAIYHVSVKNALEEIKENPFSGKPLSRELTRRYSYRIGVYRIVYKISERDKKMYVITVGHRATVYG